MDPDTKTQGTDSPQEPKQVEEPQVPQKQHEDVVSEMDEETLLQSSEEDVEINSELGKLKLKEPRRGLSGACRKRLKWLLQQGHSIEEARELCQKTMRERGGVKVATKRTRSDDSTPGKGAPPKKVRTQEEGEAGTSAGTSGKAQTQRLSYKEQLEVVKVGVIPANYPEGLLTLEQQQAVEERIMEMVCEHKADTKPKFRNCSFKPGYVVVTCLNKETAAWILSKGPDFKVTDTELKVVEEKDIPHPHIVTGYFPNSLSYSNERITTLLEKQNSDLFADQWKVLSRKDTGKNCLELVFSVNPKSYEALQKTNFQVDYRYNYVRLHPKKEKKTQQPDKDSDMPQESPKADEKPKETQSMAPRSQPTTSRETPGHSGQSNRQEEQGSSSHISSRSSQSSDKSRPGPSGRQSTSRRDPGSRSHHSSRSSHTSKGSSSDRRPLLRQERVIAPRGRNYGKPWKHGSRDDDTH